MKTGVWQRVYSLSVAIAVILATGVAPSRAQAPPDYLLTPGDTLGIDVLGQASMKQDVTVRPDGKVTFPLLGDLPVSGLTAQQVAQLVTSGLRKYMWNPVVTVTVTKYGRQLVYVQGEGVAHPGSFEIQKGWTVHEALASAGGVVPRAALKRAALIRQGNPQPIPLDLERLLLRNDQAANVALQTGDVLQVPLLEFRVAVLGEVRTAGVYDLNDNDQVLNAVARAGGFTDRAAANSVGLIRQGPDGKPVLKVVDLTKAVRTADTAQNPGVQNGDVVYVPRVAFKWEDILSWLTGARVIQLLFGGP